MRTDIYRHWSAFSKEAVLNEIKEKLVDAGEGLVGGMDPSGAALARLAAQAQQQQVDDKHHKLVRNLGVAGGTVGGAILIPSAMSALYGGIMGLQQGKGIKGKVVGAVTSSGKGVWGRLSGIPKGRKARTLINQARETQRNVPLMDKDRDALEWFADRASISSMAGRAVPDFKQMQYITPTQAETLVGPAQSALSSLITQTAVGGILGGMGAYAHYRRGQNTGTEMLDALNTPVPRKKQGI